MSPTDFTLPESLMPGNGAVRPTVRTSAQGGGSQTQSPTSPADRNVPFETSHSRPVGGKGSVSSGMDGAQTMDTRIGRRLDTNLPGSRDTSAPRNRSDRDRPRPSGRSNKSPGSSHRICKKCGEPLTGQFVRALGATFHLECFKCEVSVSFSPVVASADHEASRIVARL